MTFAVRQLVAQAATTLNGEYTLHGELRWRLSTHLEFGTAGLRGPMGSGESRPASIRPVPLTVLRLARFNFNPQWTVESVRRICMHERPDSDPSIARPLQER